MAGLLIAGMALVVLVAACEGFGSLSGDMDKIWQEVKESRSYTVSFNPNGGSYVAPQTIPYGGKAQESNTDSNKEDYIFLGWFKEPSCANKWVFNIDTVMKDITLYAKWEAMPENTWRVRFSIDDGARPSEIYVEDNKTIIQPENPVHYEEGYIFDKWYKDEGCTIPWIFKDDVVTEAIRLYGKWTALLPGEYAVRFIAKGGATVPADQARQAGQYIIEPDPPIKQAGHTFGGWYSDAQCTVPWLFDEYTVTGKTVLYALWNKYENSEERYTINFITRGGAPVPGQQIVTEDDEADAPANPARTGYTFTYWYYINSSAVPVRWYFTNAVSRNLNLFAEWTPVTYNVKFNANWPGGLTGTGTMADQTFKYDEEKPLTANGFILAGYSFAGWAKTAGGAIEFTGGQNAVNLSDTQGAEVQLFAKWTINKHKVTFDTQGGSSVDALVDVNYNTAFAKPADPTKDYGDISADAFGAGLYRHRYEFKGWFKEAACTNVWNFTTDKIGDADLTLFAKWTEPEAITLSGATASDKFTSAITYVNTLANVGTYTYILDDNVTRAGSTSNSLTRSGTKLTLLGKTSERSISLSSTGYLFRLSSGVTLVLGDKITLRGYSDNTAELVGVLSGGTLIMAGSSRIVGNTISVNTGGGVIVQSGGTFTMSGGIIGGPNTGDGNSSPRGGGVYVNGGTFTMSGTAAISGNSATINGGGVYVSSGTFTMSGGIIGDSDPAKANSAINGGGVFLESSSSFIMAGGKISNNKATGNSSTQGGGGVYIYSGSNLTMSSDANISGNSSGNHGGGVYVGGTNSSLTMSGDASLSGNIATNNGGGVYLYIGGSFTMSGDAVIAGNKTSGASANYGGGGVYLYGNSTSTPAVFSMSGGTIGGDNPEDANFTPIAGGGVHVSGVGARFEMSGGKVLGNKAAHETYAIYGGGVYVIGGTLKLSGSASVSGNKAEGSTSYGGGVYVQDVSGFTMSGNAVISKNYATSGASGSSGGGVFLTTSSFTMSGGTISGNVANNTSLNSGTNTGGGVSVFYNSTFTMEGGTIGGSGPGDANLAHIGGGVYVRASKFTMDNDALISGNKVISTYSFFTYGGGVHLDDMAEFTMKNGTIGGAAANEAYMGGGVCMGYTAKFEMKGGTISGNKATSAVGYSYGGGVALQTSSNTFIMSGGTIGGAAAADANEAVYGGGVCLNSGSFTMSGQAKILGNKAITSGDYKGSGGGVYMTNGSFTMEGGTIGDPDPDKANTASFEGGGVYMTNGSIFEMKPGASICGNKVLTSGSFGGGGVILRESAKFNMSGGTISGNSTVGTGGGVYVYYWGIFTMSNGSVISGNHASDGGGGVFINGGTLRMVDGTVYGSDAPESSLINTGDISGALFVASTSTTAQHGTFNLDTWNSNGDLSNSDITITVVDGELQP